MLFFNVLLCVAMFFYCLQCFCYVLLLSESWLLLGLSPAAGLTGCNRRTDGRHVLIRLQVAAGVASQVEFRPKTSSKPSLTRRAANGSVWPPNKGK